MTGYLKNLFQLIISPQSAWEDISGEMRPLHELMSKGLTPMVVLACLSVIARKILYRPDMSVGSMVVLVMAAAAAYGCTYFVFGELMHKRVAKLTDTGEMSAQKCFTVENYILGLLCLVQMVTDLLPESIALTYLLPAGVSIVMWKAESYLAIRKDMTLTFYLWGVGCLILPPYFIQGFFNSII